MSCAVIDAFHLNAESWLGGRLLTSRTQAISIRDALSFECKPPKGETLQTSLQHALQLEQVAIEQLPAGGLALRGDVIEKAWSADHHQKRRPSVDVFVGGEDGLLLIECKYRAMPETQIVGSVELFQHNVSRKFDATKSFLQDQGATKFADVNVVLFNADSIEKVLSMFRRLLLEDDTSELVAYHLMDTRDFGLTYGNRFNANS